MSHPSPLRVLVFGSVMLDTITVIADKDIERITMHNGKSSFLLLEQGRKVDSRSVTTHIGGGAANVSVSMARLGARVHVAAMLGNDLGAQKITRHLKSENIGVGHLNVTDTQSTGTSVLISSHDQDAAIFTHRGANKCLTLDHVKAMDFADFDLVYIASLSDQSADCFGEIVTRAKAAGAYVATNPGIRQLTSRAQDFLAACPSIDQISLNQVELTALLPFLMPTGDAPRPWENKITSGSPKLLSEGLHLSGLKLELGDVLARLHHYGVSAIALTDGKHGAYLMNASGLHYSPSVPVDPKGTAGAGDAFASTLALHLAQHEPPGNALKAASLNAASVVSHVDTQKGLLQAATLRARMGDLT